MTRDRKGNQEEPEGITGRANRRLFLKRFSFGVAGLIGAGAGLGSMAKALAVEVPFTQPESGVILDKKSGQIVPSADIPIAKSHYVGYPALTLDPNGRPVVAWADENGTLDRIFLMVFDPEKETWGKKIAVAGEESGQGWLAFQPHVAVLGEKSLVLWTGTKERKWRIVAKVFDAGRDTLSPLIPLVESDADGFIAWKPAAVSLPGGGVAFAWEERPGAGKPFVVRVRCLDASGKPTGASWSTSSSAGEDCCRPSLALHPDGKTLALVYDRYEGGGTTNVHLALLSVPECTLLGESRITHHPATDLAPDAVFNPDGSLLWIGWHTNRKGKDEWDLARWYRVRAYNVAEQALYDPAWPPPEMDLTKGGVDQGFEFVRLACAADGTLCVLGRPSHRFCLQTYNGTEWSPLYRFPVEGWGGRGQHAGGVFDSEGRLWVARRDIGANVLERIEGIPSHTSTILKPVYVPETQPPLKNIDSHYEFPVVAIGPKVKESEGKPEAWNIYFGDLHGHSWMSDGMGDPDESFRRARDIFRDDFHALTDHDNFVGKKYLLSEYEEQKMLVDHFHDPGRFIPFYAQEWTTPRTGRPHGYGHKNLYSITPDHPLFDHANEATRDTPDLFAILRKHGMIAIPHHVAWTGTDWENHDPVIQPLAEICSVHGAFEYMGNTPITHRGGIPGCFIRDALNRGLKFGIVGGSDQHGLTWQHGVCWKRNAYRAGLTGILAKELTREALFDAMRNRRTFGTSGVKLRPFITVAGHHIGEEASITGPPHVAVDVLALTPIKWITVVRNGEDIERYGGESTRSRFSFDDNKIPEGKTSYYYLRVELKNGNMAWTSPIWVTPTA